MRNCSVQCIVIRRVPQIAKKRLLAFLTLQRGVTGTARMLHALTHSSISRQAREQM